MNTNFRIQRKFITYFLFYLRIRKQKAPEKIEIPSISEERIENVYINSKTRTIFMRKLVYEVFDHEEIINNQNSNLNPKKLNFLYNIVLEKFPMLNEEKEYTTIEDIWKLCICQITAIRFKLKHDTN